MLSSNITFSTDGTMKAEYVAPLIIPSDYSELPGQIPVQNSQFHEQPEYMNDSYHGNDSNIGNDGNSSFLAEEEDGGFDSYSSPAVTRRSIKSKSTYSVLRLLFTDHCSCVSTVPQLDLNFILM